ncbi:alpha-ketoglutarate-dependent dioxygenase AlkB [Allocoleopsis franciscana]|uniref:Alkylated DNA repair protein n=1 Tax=Allocoleopsis franciscana PCC 7113 TaxID=1173027 RepID=K9WHE8_9CYAN|nr:alpha-ketoglutarate-dependent dioxygenase AlkB [Allocoleopsis franciscana]AFZ19593.1 alkylated DNA repair protein [Allocoleopsis franciscana PCC 7113]
MQNFLMKATDCQLDMTKLDLDIFQESETLTIPGLTYIPNYVDVQQQNQLLKEIDEQEWSIESLESARRIQQHGYRYEYQNGILVACNYLGDLPDWAMQIAKGLYGDRLTEIILDQVTVNEYEPGQGLRSHIDCVTCFGDTLITLSLGSPYMMEFTHSQTQERRELLLLPGSLLVLKGEARYVWQHGVMPRDRDSYQGREFIRSRRVSITFREAAFPYK